MWRQKRMGHLMFKCKWPLQNKNIYKYIILDHIVKLTFMFCFFPFGAIRHDTKTYVQQLTTSLSHLTAQHSQVDLPEGK